MLISFLLAFSLGILVYGVNTVCYSKATALARPSKIFGGRLGTLTQWTRWKILILRGASAGFEALSVGVLWLLPNVYGRWFAFPDGVVNFMLNVFLWLCGFALALYVMSDS